MKNNILFSFLFMSLILLQACGFEVVDTGHRGIETRYGEVQGNPLPEGFYFYNPFTSDIQEMDIRIKKYVSESKPFTKDVQSAVVTYALNYNLDPIASGDVFKTVGKDYANVLIPQDVEGALKFVFGQWDAVKVISNREKVRVQIENMLKKQLKKKSIIVTDFEIQNINYNDAFENP